jgi:hypothetical protein
MGIIADFETELHRRAKPQFATWHAIDLHNHTPTSGDYQYKQPVTFNILWALGHIW